MKIEFDNLIRYNAIKWWNITDMLIKAMLVTRYYPNRHLNSLTEKQIEFLYLKSN